MREAAILALLALALQVSEALLHVTSTRLRVFSDLSLAFAAFAFFVSTTGLRSTLWIVFETTLVTKLALPEDPGIARHLRRCIPSWTYKDHCRNLRQRRAHGLTVDARWALPSTPIKELNRSLRSSSGCSVEDVYVNSQRVVGLCLGGFAELWDHGRRYQVLRGRHHQLRQDFL